MRTTASFQAPSSDGSSTSGLETIRQRHLELHRETLAGANFATLETLQNTLGLSAAEIAEVVLISPRTLSRRKKDGRLEPDEADRVLRVRRLFQHARTLFDGDAAAARGWFRAPYRALGGESPLSLARTDAGAMEVESFIGRLEYGVFM